MISRLQSLSLAVVLGLSSFPALAQDSEDATAKAVEPKPPLTPEDYGQWERLPRSGHAISPDGRWLAYRVDRVEGDGELRVRSLTGETEKVFPLGTNPRFSADSTHVLWTVDRSEKDPDQEKSDEEPEPNGAGLLNVKTGKVREFDAIRTASFDETGRFLALHGSVEEDPEKKVADLQVLKLSGIGMTFGRGMTFGNVSEFGWSETSSLLALVVQTGSDAGHEVRLYEPGRDRIRTLDESGSEYHGLAWCDEGAHLAVHRSEKEATEKSPAQIVLAWRGLDSNRPARFQMDRESKLIPAGMDVVRTDLAWSSDGEKLSFGVRETEPGEDDEEDPDEDLPGVQIWHPDDVRIFPRQRLHEKRDRERALLAVWNLDRKKVIPVGTDLLGSATVLEGWRFAMEKVDRAYPWGAMFGRPFHDVWATDLETGARRKILERVRYSWPSAAGRHVLTFDGEDYECIRVEDGTRANLTADLHTSFANAEYDVPTDMTPPYGVGGWIEDDSAVLLHDRHDVWRVAPDGSSARRLTRGAEQRVQHRVEDLDEEEEAFESSKPLYFWTWSEHTEKRGYARLSPSGEVPDSLFFLDKMPGRLMKAKIADVFVFTLEAIDDSPDFFVSGPDLSDRRQVTRTNAFQDGYAWTHAELVDFDSESGVPLQAALYYPVNHDPSRRYPMIVWTYEKETPWVHIYDVPEEHDYYNFTTWTQRGYFVMLMDIAYRPRDPGICAIEAVRPAIRKIVDRGLVDPDRVGLVGHSWGGYQAAFLPTRTDLFAASVAGAPLTDFVSFMGQIHWNTGTPEPDHWETGQARMEVPFWEDPAAHERNSPIHGIQNLETPILLAHGDKDGVVEFFQSTTFYNFARRAGKQVVLLVYEGEDHGFRKKPNQVDYHRRILEWFDHYLKDSPAPDWIQAGTKVIELDEEKRRVAQVVSPSTEVFLNHCYVVLDEETHAAIRTNRFLAEQFARQDTGLPEFSSPSDDSSSLYLRGKDTYIEFFGPDNRFGEPVGKIGIGLGVDEPGHLEDVERVWNDRLPGEVIRQRQDWTRVDPPVPWMEVLLHPDTLAGSVLAVWASAYRPEFLPWLYPERTPEENGVRRADFLAPRFDPDRLFENVTGLILALPDELRNKLARQLEAVGYEKSTVEGSLRLQGRDWSLSLVEATSGRTGIVGLEFSLTREKEGNRIFRLGSRSVLVFGPGKTATWSFL